MAHTAGAFDPRRGHLIKREERGMTMRNELPENIIQSLRSANQSAAWSTKAIRDAYAEAEESDDYSDADELAADHREALHRDFLSLLKAFASEYPDLGLEEI